MIVLTVRHCKVLIDFFFLSWNEKQTKTNDERMAQCTDTNIAGISQNQSRIDNGNYFLHFPYANCYSNSQMFINLIKWCRVAFTYRICSQRELQSCDEQYSIISLAKLDLWLWSVDGLSLPHKMCWHLMVSKINRNTWSEERDFFSSSKLACDWADRCHRKFSQSRRAYLRLDDLYPYKNSCLNLCKSLRHHTNTGISGAKHYQGS